ncbi:MAG: gliding motility-associated ABC transporter substrate-binding protein GldG [Bacteroidetes bacterium]|nr:gliding motility-associated ABC transporter substrate-binding protein GldG [Bacteroidota bacterium]
MMGKKIRNIRQNNIIQLVMGLIIIILLNIIGQYIFTRFDLTSEKRYTLTPATKDLLRNLDDVVYFKIYLEGEFPAGFKRLSRSTKEMLDEFRAYSNKIQYEFINPSKVGNAGEVRSFYQELIRKGLNPTDLTVKTSDGTSQQIIFPGGLVTYKSREIPVQFLLSQMGQTPEYILNSSVQNLEYTLSSSIRKVTIESKPSVAFIEGHGELKAPYVYDITNALKEFYTVERVKIDEKINSLTQRDSAGTGQFIVKNKYKAIIIAQPDSAFSEKDKFIIDQFIMRSGKVLWLIDPVYASMDSLENSNLTMGLAMNLNLDDQLFTYGVRLNPDLVLDLNALPIRIVTGMIGDQPQIEFLPWPFFPVITPTGDHPIIKNLNALMTHFASSLDTVGAKGIKKTILLTTSQYSHKLQTPVLISLDMLKEEPDQKQYSEQYIPIAALLEGEFQSVFRNRIPPEIRDNPLIDFHDISPPNKMIVVADGDIILNQMHMTQGYPLPLGFDQYTRQTFGNRDFIMNAMNYLCDDSGSIAARTREVKLRLLDKTKISDEKITWQLINILIPILLVGVMGVVQYLIRKRKYSR